MSSGWAKKKKKKSRAREMKRRLTLYTRADCCLCDEMKRTVEQVAAKVPLEFEAVDVADSAELEDRFGNEVPVLFIDGKKTFKYRVTAKELETRLGGGRLSKLRGLARRGE